MPKKREGKWVPGDAAPEEDAWPAGIMSATASSILIGGFTIAPPYLGF